MSPSIRPAPEIAAARVELERQDREVQELVDRHGEALVTRPPTGRWSVAEHLLHLALLNGPYLRVMKEAAREGRAAGTTGSGPYPDPLIGRMTIWFMEPPPKLRTGTLQNVVPRTEDLDLPTAVRDFERAQAGFRVLLEDADGLDLGKIRFQSPFASWLPFTLDQGIRMLLAHNRRHLWLSREALSAAGATPRPEG